MDVESMLADESEQGIPNRNAIPWLNSMAYPPRCSASAPSAPTHGEGDISFPHLDLQRFLHRRQIRSADREASVTRRIGTVIIFRLIWTKL
jgi:hypothetical protein